MRLTLLICAFVFSACQMAPTKIGEAQSREFDLVVDKAQRPLEIGEHTVVLDTRSSFDYGLNRVTNSLHFPWESLAEDAQTGEIMRDKRKAALRLSLNGLQPQTPVIVVGYGPAGKGEEGRLAWTLMYFGFQDVQIAGIDMFRSGLTQNPSPQAKNADIWELTTRDRMAISKAEFSQLALDPKGRMEKRVFLIDVRSESEYLNKNGGTVRTPDLNAINIEWKEFYNALGRPNPKLPAKLASVGIQASDRIILISNKGVRSASAAYALLALGFARAQNYAGGWEDYLRDVKP